MPSHLPVIRLQSGVKPLRFEPSNTIKYKEIQKYKYKYKNTNENINEKYESLIRLQSGVKPLKSERTKTLTALFSGAPKHLDFVPSISSYPDRKRQRQAKRKIPMTNNIILVEIAFYQPYIAGLTFSSPVDILK